MKQLKDWNKADKDGTINVPDYLDDAVNKVGMQIRFHTISGKNEVQTICDIVYGLESYFEKMYSAENEKLSQALIDMKSQLMDKPENWFDKPISKKSFLIHCIDNVINEATI